MAQTIRVTLPGNDVFTETDQDHFALYADEDWVLIKEFARGYQIVPAGQERNISLSLGYIPFVMVFFRYNNIWRSCNGQFTDYTTNTESGDNLPIVYLTESFMVFNNPTNESVEFKFFICYDNQL